MASTQEKLEVVGKDVIKFLFPNVKVIFGGAVEAGE